MREERCIILDFLPEGYAGKRHPEPMAQAIGRDFFTILEVVPKEGVTLKSDEDVYIGEKERDRVRTVKGVIEYDRLTAFSKSILPAIIERIIKEEEPKYIEFMNKAGIITPRLHKMELIPGIGKKHLQDLLDERRKRPFTSFAELRERVRLFPDPVKSLVARVMQELQNEEKYYIFVMQKKRA